MFTEVIHYLLELESFCTTCYWFFFCSIEIWELVILIVRAREHWLKGEPNIEREKQWKGKRHFQNSGNLPRRAEKGKHFTEIEMKTSWFSVFLTAHEKWLLQCEKRFPFSTLGPKKPIWLFQQIVSKNFAIDVKIYNSDCQELNFGMWKFFENSGAWPP